MVSPPAGAFYIHPLFFLSMNDEKELLCQLRSHNIKAFKRLCYDHANGMTDLAYSILQDDEQAINVVDGILYKLWNDADFPIPASPFQQFLHIQVLNSCRLILPRSDDE
jgi:hypothetical protein